jgi:hypothetical protein
MHGPSREVFLGTPRHLIIDAYMPLQVKQQRTFSQPGRHDINAAFLVEHNTLLARTRLNGTMYSGPDRAYKAVVNLDTFTVRLSIGLSPRRPAMHALTLPRM